MKFDTHIHTNHSLCSTLKPEKAVETAAACGLHTVVVKDHNLIYGALEAKAYAEEGYKKIHGVDCPVNVELGIEVRTEYGELGIDFLTEHEAKIIHGLKNTSKNFWFQDVYNAVNELRENKDSRLLVCLHHPFSFSIFDKRGSFDFYGVCGKDPLTGKGDSPFSKEHPLNSLAGFLSFIDYTELNGNNYDKKGVECASALAKAYGMPIVVSTDAHFKRMIGRYYTIAKGGNVRDSIVENNLELPFGLDDISYLRSFYYRSKSGLIIRPFKKLFKKFISSNKS